MMEQEVSGIVLSVSEYREKDALITILTDRDMKIRFVARGVQTITSKNAGALLVGTQSFFVLQMKEHRDLHMLKQARVQQYRRHIGESLLKQALSLFYCELFLKCENVEHGYELLVRALDDLEKKEDNYTCACVLINLLCMSQGIAPWVDSCVSCGRIDQIATLSLKQGGFLCKQCMDHLHERAWSKKQLQRFRYLCHANIDQIDLLRKYTQYDFQDLAWIYSFFQEYSGISINSYAFVKQVATMNAS